VATGRPDKFPDELDNRPGELDKNTSDRDVYPGHDFTLTSHRNKNTGDRDAFLGVFWCDRDPKKC